MLKRRWVTVQNGVGIKQQKKQRKTKYMNETKQQKKNENSPKKTDKREK